MARIKTETGLAFDDILLVPRKSSVKSRFGGEIDLSTKLLPGVNIKFPILSANMDTVSGFHLVQKMNDLGATGIIHRFIDIDVHKEYIKNLSGIKIGCIGIGTGGQERAQAIAEYCDAILIDVAHGHSDGVLEQIEWLKDNFPLPVIAGNVATRDGANDLISAGADCIKAGVGPGSLCSTRTKTGNGVPQVTTIMECRKAIDALVEFQINHGLTIKRPTLIADGGIKESGDIVKALALGADAVMIGNLFAGVDEAPGKPIQIPGKGQVKIYRGMASRDVQEDWKGAATSVEGEMNMVPYKGALEPIFNDIMSGVFSGMSYQNARNLKELYDNAVFIRQTSAGIRESAPHGLLK